MQEISFVATVSEDTLTTTDFTTDISKTDVATVTLAAEQFTNFKIGRILEIGYRLNPTAAETYTLMILEDSEADDYHNNSHILYESAAARVDDTDYRVACNLPFKLATEGTFLIATDWTGAPGNTTGYIRISGVAYI